MGMASNELIHRYLQGLATDEEVRTLEQQLIEDEQFQEEFLFQADIDAHLRQEVQSVVKPPADVVQRGAEASSVVWKCVSGISTLIAIILLAVVIVNLPPQQTAQAHPSLGELNIEDAQTGQNIWFAAAAGDLDAVHKAVHEGVSVNAESEHGLAPIHFASLFNHPKCVELLLSNGADVSLTDREGNTPLHMAAFLGNTDVVRVLLKAGADPAVRNMRGFSSPDNVAVKWSSGLEAYYHNLEDWLDTTLDLERIREQRPAIFELLTAGNPDSANRVPTVNVWLAAITGNTAAIEQHVAAGTDLNAKEDLGGSTPLMLAAVFGKPEVAAILIDRGANLDERNKTGGTALHVACFFCRPEIVKLLLNAGAETERTNNRGLTPLEVVTIDFDARSEGAYRHTYDSLGLTFDSQHVQKTRSRIAVILRSHANNEDRAPAD